MTIKRIPLQCPHGRKRLPGDATTMRDRLTGSSSAIFLRRPPAGQRPLCRRKNGGDPDAGAAGVQHDAAGIARLFLGVGFGR
ncbi:MAG: hypothetical protein MZV64_28880 [Ignavibacteriales bacterium]|nr:hypothetical protein [Ignavibacteriales bacterium]